MHFAAKNLLYTFNQSLNAQFVTVASFKRYARSPEQRTFTNYFRPSKIRVSYAAKGFFTTYMRKRDQYALSRYITVHRKKKNPILTTFTTRITNIILKKLQHLNIAPSGRTAAGQSSNPGRCPGLSYTAPSVRQQDGPKGRGITAQPNGLGNQAPTTNPNAPKSSPPAKGEYSEGGRGLLQNKKTQNKPISKTSQNAISPYCLKPGTSSLKSGPAKNKPISNPINTTSQTSNSKTQLEVSDTVPLRHPKQAYLTRNVILNTKAPLNPLDI